MQKKCIIYCRVSSPQQAQEGESLDEQEKICRRIAQDRGYKIVPNNKVFREPYSGRKNFRPVLDEVLAYIKDTHSEVDYFIFRVIDRFTRGGAFAYESIKRELAKYGVALIDSYGIIQPPKNTLEHLDIKYDWSEYYPSSTAEMMTAEYGSAEVRNILTRLIGREIELTRQGYKTRPANDGYLNKIIEINNKKKPIQIPDPERAKYYIEMFKLRAGGQCSDKEIADKINAMGFRTKIKKRWDKNHEQVIGKIGGKTLSVKQLQVIIRNPNYCGVICEKWTHFQPIKADWEGLISIDTFNKANRGKVFIKEHEDSSLQIFYDYKPERSIRRRSKNNPLFPYKFILCPHCKKPMLGSSPKGKSGKKFPTYHCGRQHKYFGVKKKQFEDNIEKFIKQLKFTQGFLDSFESVIKDRYRTRQKEITKVSADVSQNIGNLKIEKQQILDSLIKTESEVVRKELETKIEKVEKQIASAQEQRQEVEVTEYDISAFINYAKFLMEHPAKLLLDDEEPVNINQKQALFGLVFDEFPTYQEIVNGTPKLSLIFELSQANKDKKSVMVPPLGIEPRSQAPQACVLSIELRGRM